MNENVHNLLLSRWRPATPHGVAALAANFVAVPAWAFGISTVLGLQVEVHQGLVILSFVAVATFVYQLGTMARENVGVLAGLMAIMLVDTAVIAPIVLPLVLPGASVDAVDLALLLASTMLVPLAVGMGVRAALPAVASRLVPWTGKLAFAAMLGMMVGQFLTSVPIQGSVGWRSYAAALLLIVGAYVVGVLTGYAGRGTGVTPVGTAILTSQRNMAAGMLVATSSFGNSVVTIIMVSGMVAFMALVPLCHQIGVRRARPA